MKKLYIVTLITISALLTGCTDEINSDLTAEEIEVVEEIIEDEIIEDLEDPIIEELYYDINSTFGSNGALGDEYISLEEMLIYAIQDEYAARAEYEYILNNFEITTPFSKIIKAEVKHIEMLLPLFETYNVLVPEDTSSEHLIEITSLVDTYATGVQAEILNIAMYNLFLSQDDLPQDVIDIFTNLRDASEKHLAAFEKNLAKTQTS
jgi:hypothetical protein